MKNFLILLLIHFLTCNCIAQNNKVPELHFNHLSIKDGLPEDVITTSLEDKEGYIWIGTQAGIVRYDGYSTKVYNFGMDDPGHSTVTGIYEDRNGKLWVGANYNGLFQYDRANDKFLSFNLTPGDPRSEGFEGPVAFQDDRNGNLWIILADIQNKRKYLRFFDASKKQFKHFGITEKGNQFINASTFNDMFEDIKGSLWIGTNNGIYEYSVASDKMNAHFASTNPSLQNSFGLLREDPAHPGVIWLNRWSSSIESGLLRYNISDHSLKVFSHIKGDPTSLANDSIMFIQKDPTGNRLLIGTFSGLSILDLSNERFTNYFEKERATNTWNNTIRDLKIDKEGNYWCLVGDGLLLFDLQTKQFTRFKANENDPNALPYGYISNLLIDRSGNLWFGTFFQGLYWLNSYRSRFEVYKNNPSHPYYFPGGGNTSFAEDKDHTYWIWAADGLYHWYPSSDSFVFAKRLRNQKENVPFHFSSVLIDQKGIIWCNSMGEGLFSFDPNTKRVNNFIANPEDSNSLSTNLVTTIYEDRKGILWVGTIEAGLCRFNRETGKFRRYPYSINQLNPPKGVLNDNTIFCIYEDRQGIFWIGTNLGGLYTMDRMTATFTRFQDQVPSINAITSIFEDSKGNLWVGTHVSGLFRCDYKSNTVKRYTEADGLLYNGSLAIKEDNANKLWISSSRGISITDAQLNKTSWLAVKNGLPEIPENNLNFFKASDGRFLIPVNNGFMSFYPGQLKSDSAVPIIHIESVKIGNPRKKEDGETDSIIYAYGKTRLKLRYFENRITFNYVGLQYQNSELNQYAFKLDGYDKDWIQGGTMRRVTYTNLSPGTYVFHLKAANSDGIWNNLESSLTIVISPPWWLTWWAYVLYAIAIASALWAFIAYRSRRLKRKNIELEEKITQRTSQLNESLEHLKSTQTQLIQSEKMASLGELTAGIAHEIQNPLNFVNNFSEVNTELLQEMKQEIDKGNFSGIKGIADDIIDNEEKINHHGKRADAIVKGMLQHSRSSGGNLESTNINALADEYLRLSYHGLRAKDKTFNVHISTDFDESIGNVNIIPQDIGRLLLNLYNNALYAVNEKKKSFQDHYEPIVSVRTKLFANRIEIKIKDNGNGIPQKVLDKVFQPFFTTKPTGQGTGLGLSISYDIVKAHGGEIKVVTEENEGTEFTIELPRG